MGKRDEDRQARRDRGEQLIQIWLSKELVARIDKLAKSVESTRAGQIRIVLSENVK